MARTPDHLLVRLPNPLGDAVLATPALRGLRAALPDARITWAGRRAALQALDGLEDRDGVMPVAGRFASGLLSPWRAGRMWRRARPDAVLLLPHSLRSALAACVCGAGRRTGWGAKGRAALLTESVTLPLEGKTLAPRSMVEMYLDLAAPYGATDDGEGPRVVATPFDRRRAAIRLAGRAEGASVLAVNPGAAFGPSKVYPAKHLAVVLRTLRDERGLIPLVLCGPGEEALARDLSTRVGEPVISTHEAPPDLGELKALLAKSAALLTTDAGPRHLAEALGVPTVAVLGPTDPRWTAHSRAVVVRKEGLDCLACHHRACPIHHPCMEDLAPEVVADAVIQVLAASGDR